MLRILAAMAVIASLGGCAAHLDNPGSGPQALNLGSAAPIASAPKSTRSQNAPKPDTATRERSTKVVKVSTGNSNHATTKAKRKRDAKEAATVARISKALKRGSAQVDDGLADDVAYRIGPLDEIEVTVFKVAELSRSFQISETGTFSFPLIGDVRASGKTARETERVLARRLGSKYLQNPQVTVRVTAFNSKRITVDGAVVKPGVYPITGSMTLVQAVATAGGLGPTANTTVVVFREKAGKRHASKHDLSEIRGGSAEDPQLRAGDVIVATDSSLQKALGQVLKVLPIAGLLL
ncbi:MAG: polysaccharide biosynthesis/export family protein [Pseudomonadota bacterium]